MLRSMMVLEDTPGVIQLRTSQANLGNRAVGWTSDCNYVLILRNLFEYIFTGSGEREDLTST